MMKRRYPLIYIIHNCKYKKKIKHISHNACHRNISYPQIDSIEIITFWDEGQPVHLWAVSFPVNTVSKLLLLVNRISVTFINLLIPLTGYILNQNIKQNFSFIQIPVNILAWLYTKDDMYYRNHLLSSVCL
jgi:hypothetical protein